MEKPRITIYKIEGKYFGFNETVNKFYSGVFPITTIFNILKTIYLCQKDEKGNYLTDLDPNKPVFD